ncbi:MAG: Ig-like domain-containing protein, partial [Bacteroidota bacterium]
MQRILFFILSFLPAIVFAQLQDDFTDGDFTNGPTWNGDAAMFIVNASQQLQLNNTVADTSYLSVPNAMATLDNMEWHFWIKQSFSPSSSNYGRVYLVSDQSILTGAISGYYLQFGEALGLDAVELFRQDGSASTSVCRGTDAEIANSFTIGVKVTRDGSGSWSLSVDPAGGTNYIQEATGNDNTYNTSSFFGVECVYTSSNANKFYFDDIYVGAGSVDVTPPTIVSATAISTTQLDLLFSETVDQVTGETAANYSVNSGIGTPSTSTRDGSNFSLVHLQFANAFATATTYTITVSNVNDGAGNTIAANSTTTFTYALDVTPPALSTATAVSATQLDLLFSEAVDIATSQVISNYSVDNAVGSPVNALRDGSNFSLVHLTFSNSFSAGTTYTLTVNNIKDLAANTIAANSTAFFNYVVSGAPIPFDVVITEFMADPDPVVGLPNTEYIEIYNRSNKIFDLSGWKIGDSGAPHDLTAFQLKPDSFLILCSTAAVSSFIGFGSVMGVTSFPSLNNTGGDDVILYDINSVVIDKVHYDESFYRDLSKIDGGWSIERIDPDFTCTSDANWKASVAPAGGTPGTVNSIDGDYSDNTAPRLLRACLDDSLHVT